MIHIYTDDQIPQGSDEWHAIRNGKVTGTDGYDLLRGKTISEIIEHKLNARPFRGNYYTKRGHILEDEARDIYSDVYAPITKVGFVTNDAYPMAGVSPDGLIGTDGYWECKAFNDAKHLEVYRNLDAHVLAQIQFGLMITERKWCDLTLFNPDMPRVEQQFLIRRIYPRDDIQKKFKEALSAQKVLDNEKPSVL